MKKLLSIALALVMALSLCVTTTWAAETVHEIASLEAAVTAGYISFDPTTGKVTLAAGSYKLTGDVTIPATVTYPAGGTTTVSTPVIEINGEVTIDLNDHVLAREKATDSYASVLKVNGTSGKLTLNDSSTTKTTRYFTVDDTGLWTLTTDTTANSVTGGIITGGTGTKKPDSAALKPYHGGGVYVDAGGSFTMNGGSIVGCTADYNAGGVYNAGAFTMNGGAIIGCTTQGTAGGGVVNSSAAFTMNGGIIKDCKADGTDDAVNSVSTTMNANGGKIYGTVWNTDSTIANTSTSGAETEFYGNVVNKGLGGKATIEAGIFYGEATNVVSQSIFTDLESYITGGAFYGGITNQADGNKTPVTELKDEEGKTVSTYTVKFDLSGGTSVKAIPDQVFVSSTSYKAIKPATDPTREGYTFGGWYKDAAEWDFDTVVTGDMTLTAKWTEIPTEQTPAETPAHSHTRRQPTTTTTVVTPDTTTTDTVTSAKTFDAGIAVYGVMAVLSVTGSAWVVGKKRG